MAGAGEPVVLFNALSGSRDVYVLCGGKPKCLPRAQVPMLVDDAQRVGEVDVTVLGECGGAVLDVVAVTGQSRPFVLGDLPEVSGVWYLVDPDVLAQFPHRGDFVTPATYVMWWPKKWEQKLKSAGRKKARKVLKKMTRGVAAGECREKYFPLASVCRGPLPVAGPGMPVCDID